MEASLLVPILFLAVLFVLSAMLFCYDRCLLDFDTNSRVIKLSTGRDDLFMEEQLEKYYGFEYLDSVTKKDGNRIEISQRGQFLLNALWGEVYSIKKAMKKSKPASVLRSLKAGKQLIEREESD